MVHKTQQIQVHFLLKRKLENVHEMLQTYNHQTETFFLIWKKILEENWAVIIFLTMS